MASSNGQGDHDGLIYYLRRAKELTFSEVKNCTLPEELQCSEYSMGWQRASFMYFSRRYAFPQHNWDLMEKECFIAVMCYTLLYPKIGRSLNDHCRRARPMAESWDAFPYKSLFFFLIEAFEKLSPFAAGRLYRGTRMLGPKAGNRVRFVQFVSATVSVDIARCFGSVQLVLTGVPPSLVRDISFYSDKQNHKEVLIWPFCTFDLVNAADVVDPADPFRDIDRERFKFAFRDANPSVGQRSG